MNGLPVDMTPLDGAAPLARTASSPAPAAKRFSPTGIRQPAREAESRPRQLRRATRWRSPAFVADASVAIGWVHPGQATAGTAAMLEAIAGGATLEVPALWPLELANALVVLVRRRKLREDERQTALGWLRGLRLRIDHEASSLAMSRLSDLAAPSVRLRCCLPGVGAAPPTRAGLSGRPLAEGGAARRCRPSGLTGRHDPECPSAPTTRVHALVDPRVGRPIVWPVS